MVHTPFSRHENISPCRILSEVVTNFPTNLEEVTLTADPERTQLRNYIEDEGLVLTL